MFQLVTATMHHLRVTCVTRSLVSAGIMVSLVVTSS